MKFGGKPDFGKLGKIKIFRDYIKLIENTPFIRQILQRVRISVNAFLEKSRQIEISGYLLEPRNHTLPKCPDIIINEPDESIVGPKAWSINIAGEEHWFYNYQGALAEAGFLGKEIPTIHEWSEIILNMRGDMHQKATALNIPLIGFRDVNGEDDAEFLFIGHCSYLLSSTPKGNQDIWYISFEEGLGINKYWMNHNHGLSLRFITRRKDARNK